MTLLWSLHLSKKFFGRAYWKGWASIFIRTLLAYRKTSGTVTWAFFDTLIHEELHLLLKRWGEGGHLAEKTVLEPCSQRMADAIFHTPEIFEPMRLIMADIMREAMIFKVKPRPLSYFWTNA